MSARTPSLPRVVTLGDSGVGKTALITRMKTGEFFATTIPTIGAGVTLLDTEIESGNFSLQIWDTAGQELYRSIIPVYFKGAMLALLVFSIADRPSFDHLDSWLNEIHRHADEGIEIILVASKYDVMVHRIEDDNAKQYAADHELKLFFTSACTGQNVAELLHFVAVSLAGKAALKVSVNIDEEMKRTRCC
jgi:small GTP-binding protein